MGHTWVLRESHYRYRGEGWLPRSSLRASRAIRRVSRRVWSGPRIRWSFGRNYRSATWRRCMYGSHTLPLLLSRSAIGVRPLAERE